MERNPNEGGTSGTSGSGMGASGAGAGGSGSGLGGSGLGGSGLGGSTGGTGGYGASTGGASGSTGGYGESFGSGTGGSGAGGMGGSYGSTGTAESKVQQGKEKLGEAKDAAADKLGKAREKAGDLKSSLADKLEAGAEKLRSRNQSGSYAGATGAGSASIASDDRMAEVSNRVAGGLQASADWIREADVDSVRSGIETQVKEHPGRTLLIAAGIGYLLGKAFRR
jgi:hypothetical protein